MNPEAPRCVVIAGPNGAGKTTFAREFLVRELGIVHFVNADLIAAGLSPLKPELARVEAGRTFLHQVDDMAARRLDFSFETTMSGRSHEERLKRWQQEGYRITVAFLRLETAELCLDRIAARVAQGGHDVAEADALRRYERGWRNFIDVCRPLADEWSIYDNSGTFPVLKEHGLGAWSMSQNPTLSPSAALSQQMEAALLRAAQRAREEAIRYGTPIVVSRDGKVVALDPRTMEPLDDQTDRTERTDGATNGADHAGPASAS